MDYFDEPLIFTPPLYRAAQVSPTRGDKVLKRLEGEGRIQVRKNPTGRKALTPRDGEVLYKELVGA